MKERPILFSTPMVKALLARQKTQTRRVIKLRKGDTIGNISVGNKVEEWIICDKDGDEVPLEFACPYGSVGDRLWVRETHYRRGYWTLETLEGEEHWRFHAVDGDVIYLASDRKPLDLQTRVIHHKNCTKTAWWKRPAIFLPRWASRITLEITDVRVQRVQDISEDDVKAEGTPEVYEKWNPYPLSDEPDHETLVTGKLAYMNLWNKINGKTYPWICNPWVWALSFKVL